MKNLNRWVYAIVGVIVLLLAGLVYAWSTMGKSIGAATGWDAGQLSLTFTLVMAFFCIGCLLAGIFAKKVSPKIYVILSGVLFLVGFLIAGSVASLATLYLGFGVLCGLGAGFAYNAVMSTMSQWFPDKQGLISGVLLMGFGLSAFIIGKVFAAVAPADGSFAWMGTFKILGIIIVIVMIICAFFFVKPEPGYNPSGTAGKKKVVREPASDVNTATMCKSVSFWLYYAWAILISAAGLVLVSQAAGIATQVGEAHAVSGSNIATVVGLISIFNGVGRVCFGTLFDKKGFKLTIILDVIIFLVAAAIILVSILTMNYVLVVVGFIVGGFAYGGVTPTNSALISDFYGRTHYPINFSIINTNLLIASFASTIAGKLVVASGGDYKVAIYMMFVVTIASFVVFLGIRRPKSN